MAFQTIASPAEHFLVTSDPAELADYTNEPDLATSKTAEFCVDLGLIGESDTSVDGDGIGFHPDSDDGQIELDTV